MAGALPGWAGAGPQELPALREVRMRRCILCLYLEAGEHVKLQELMCRLQLLDLGTPPPAPHAASACGSWAQVHMRSRGTELPAKIVSSKHAHSGWYSCYQYRAAHMLPIRARLVKRWLVQTAQLKQIPAAMPVDAEHTKLQQCDGASGMVVVGRSTSLQSLALPGTCSWSLAEGLPPRLTVRRPSHASGIHIPQPV